MDAIRRKILEKVATFSTWPGFHQAEDKEAEDTADPDLVVTTVSDADSAGDGKVVAKSVEGEEDMVDVTMDDVNDAKRATQPTAESMCHVFSSQTLRGRDC